MATIIVKSKTGNCQEGSQKSADNCSGASQQSPSNTPRNKHLMARIARRSAWLRDGASYLDYMHYYKSHAPRYIDDTEIEHMRGCQHVWLKEHKGEASRFRGIGCGNRRYDMLCGSYAQLIYSREASRQMADAQEALEVVQGITPESYGIKLVLPLVKSESERIDALLESDYKAWELEVNALYNGVAKLVKSWYGEGIGFTLSLDYTGESSPTEPHYHINAYVFPARRTAPGYWSALERWHSADKLEAMRNDWRDWQNESYGISLTQANIKAGFIAGKGGLYHWLRYLYRHSLSDIWRGWRGYEGEVVSYGYKKVVKGKLERYQLEIPAIDMVRAFKRADLIPKHHKRIRHYGIFSDGQRGKTMASLGMVREERKDDGESEGWVRDNSYILVRFERDGIVLKPLRPVYEFDDNAYTLDGSELAQFKVLNECLSYAPGGVNPGRRVIWRAPGGS